MATNPMMQSPMGQEQEGPAEDAMPGEEADGGVVELVIRLSPGGGISVYKEVGEDESAEQSAQDVNRGQALSWALKEMQAFEAGSSGGDAQSQFQAGFGAEAKPQRMIG